MGDVIEKQVSIRAALGKISTFSHESWDITLKKIGVYILEMEDVLFHHNSAVMMPENPAGVSSADGSEDDATDPDDATIKEGQEKVTGVKALALIFRQLEFDPKKKLIVVGHTDTSGEAGYNFKLSDLRAQNVLYLLTNERKEWTKISYEKHKVEDYQQILTYIFKSRKWPCNPGKIDNKWGDNTRRATENFIRFYNSEFANKQKPKLDNLSSGLVNEIKRDGKKRWPRELWGAVYDLYSEDISETFGVNRSELDNMRDKLRENDNRFVDKDNKFLGCGESFPIDDSEKENYRSQSNRRVVILLFDKDEAPELNCPAQRKKVHEEKECPLWHAWHFIPVYIDPKDLYAVVYHLRFKYFDRITGKIVDVPDGLIIQAVENGNKKLNTISIYKKGVYHVKVQFQKPLKDPSHKSLHFEMTTKDQWIYTKNDKSDPKIVTKKLEDFEDPKKVPFEDKFKYYDLPAPWSSQKAWTRYDNKLENGAAYEEVFKTKLKLRPLGDKLTKPEKPLMFCLDDIVLTDKTFKPIALSAGTHNCALLDKTFDTIDPDTANEINYYTKGGIKSVLIPIKDKKIHGVALAGKLYGVFTDRIPGGKGYDYVGFRAAVYKHEKKCIPIFEGFNQYHYRGFEIGNYDSYLVREQGFNSKDKEEIAYIFHYFKWHFRPKPGNTVGQVMGEPADAVKAATKWKKWKKETNVNIVNIWNDKTKNQLVALFHENKAKKVKHRVFIRYYMENVGLNQPNKQHTIINVHPAGAAGRSNMGRNEGNIRAHQNKPDPANNNRFTVAHEFGHSSSLDDEYIERTNSCGYWNIGVYDFKPGSPYYFDEPAMMKANQDIRSRHYWHYAEWMHKQFIPEEITAFCIQKKDDPDYQLPLKDANTWKPGDKHKLWDSHINFPNKSSVDAENSKKGKGKFNLYLYPLGEDKYCNGDAISLYKNKKFTGLLVVKVNLYFKFATKANYNNVNGHIDIYNLLDKIFKSLTKKFPTRGKPKGLIPKFKCIKICGKEPFKETFIQIQPRFLVDTYTPNFKPHTSVTNQATYTVHVNGRVLKWWSRKKDALGEFVKLPSGKYDYEHINRPEAQPHYIINVKESGSSGWDGTAGDSELSLNKNHGLKFWKYFSQMLGLNHGKTLSKSNFAVGNFVPEGVVKNV